MIRTRFAPSPTGFLHIGGIRTALYNYLFAKKNGGEFLLRIEDTDKERFVEGAEKYIIDTLEWFDMLPDHGPNIGEGKSLSFRQSERSYKKYVYLLLLKDKAYYAFDTPEELKALREKNGKGKPFSYDVNTRGYLRNSLTLSKDETSRLLESGAEYTIRMKMPKNKEVRFTDMVRGNVVFDTSTLDDKVLFKSDGTPTYHLANVVDDHLMNITHVIRGEEWLSSTPLHLLLYEALEWDRPEFAHLPLLLDETGKKISKRKAVTAGFPIFPFEVNIFEDDGTPLGLAKGFKEEGYDPKALLNYLALLGWNPKNNKEIMSIEEMIELFDIACVNNSGAVFDTKKASHFNRIHLQKESDESLVSCLPENRFNYSKENLNKIARAATERASFKKDIPNVISYFFDDINVPIEQLKNIEEFETLLSEYISVVTSSIWEVNKLNDVFISLIEKNSAHRGSMLNNLRICLTGGASGPKIHEMMDMMGRDEFLRRLTKVNISLEKNLIHK